jgi:exodeoxyribonuclease VII small subunit
MAKAATDNNIAAMSFEDALKELEDIVRSLEQGKAKLDDAIAAYERGAKLKAHCEKKLSEAKMKIDQIEIGPGGEVRAEKADIE